MTHEQIIEILEAAFAGQLSDCDTAHGISAITIPAASNLKVLQFLYDSEDLQFRFLTDLTAVHYPNRTNEELCVVYHLHSLYLNKRLRIKLYVPVAAPKVFTASKLFSGANWMERETFDFYGVDFVGHPNLKRILNVDEMDYFPMRKEYPMEDPTRIDKDDEMFGRGGTIC